MKELFFPQNATEKERTLNWKQIAEISDKDFGFTNLEEKADKIRFKVKMS